MIDTTSPQGMERREKEFTAPLMEVADRNPQAWYKLVDFWGYTNNRNPHDSEEFAVSVSKGTVKVDDTYLKGNIF